MVKRRLIFTFPPELITEPVIYNLTMQFRLVTNIRHADITEKGGWVELELEGEEKDIEEGITWVTSKGVKVNSLPGSAL